MEYELDDRRMHPVSEKGGEDDVRILKRRRKVEVWKALCVTPPPLSAPRLPTADPCSLLEQKIMARPCLRFLRRLSPQSVQGRSADAHGSRRVGN